MKGTMSRPKPRTVPRPFEMHWGKGQIVEEASMVGPHHEPAIQLMEYEDGSWSIRFAYYNHGRFQRGPLMIGPEELDALRKALNDTPRLKALLKKLIK